MRIGIVGTGYVGLVTAVCFAKLGHSVVAMDKDREVIGRLAAGNPTRTGAAPDWRPVGPLT